MYRALALLVIVAAPVAAQNIVINGDFEKTALTGCNFNLPNPDFTAAFRGCTGFGTQLGNGEIDVMQGGDCGYGLPAASGLVKLGIASDNDGTGSDAFSFKLRVPVVPGRAYRLTFQANAHVTSFSPEIGAVEVGLSSSATAFGDKVGELVPSAVAWSTFDQIIVPATAATYLTVRYQETADGWDHVDNFTLEPGGSAGLTAGGDGTTIRVEGAAPGSLVALLVSPAVDAGGAPSANAWGLSLAPPVTLAAVLVADDVGGALCERGMLAIAPVQLQAVDLSTGSVSPVATLEPCIPAGAGPVKSATPTPSGHGPAQGGDSGTHGPSPPTP